MIKILYVIVIIANLILMIYEGRLLRKTRENLDNTDELLAQARAMPKVVPCYECQFYHEDEPFCPKSGMRMKDGLIFCCYGERKEKENETL